MRFLRDDTGDAAVEWLVVAVIVVAIVGGIILTLHQTIRARLEAVNSSL